MAGAGPASQPGALHVALAVGLGTLEGAIVGGAQWLVLRERLAALPAHVWVLATAAGAFVAWCLGLLPSLLMDMSAQDGAGSARFSAFLTYVLAAILGAIAGPILACFQWLALRRHVARARVWIPANAVAWAVGMPLVFVGPALVVEGMPTVEAAPIFLSVTCAAGALVGAVHGYALVRFILPPFRQERAAT